MSKIENTDNAIKNIDNNLASLQDRYVALQNKEIESSSFSPSNKKVIKLSNNQAAKPNSTTKFEAQSASEVSNYLETS